MIKSLFDNDLYKLTMQNAVRLLYPEVRVKYRFIDRRPRLDWTPKAFQSLNRKIKAMSELRLTREERLWGESRLPWVNPSYWDMLAAYRYNPEEVDTRLEKGHLQLGIAGFWGHSIPWEVPALALASETYYEEIDTNWSHDGQEALMLEKSAQLQDAEVPWGDFGTRRRRDFESQERVVRICHRNPNFTGTSNVHLAMKYDIKPLGTMAHEWPMAHSVLFSLRHANRFSMNAWNDVYRGNLGTALPDTFGTDAFLRDFDGVLARLFDSVRHDSADPYAFTEKFIAHYTQLGINWRSKQFGYTDGNDVKSAIALKSWLKEKGGQCWFGIGTSMTNDFGPSSPALSIVIKLSEVIDRSGVAVSVVKLSDTPEKATGDEDALRVARWTHFGTPLDAK